MWLKKIYVLGIIGGALYLFMFPLISIALFITADEVKASISFRQAESIDLSAEHIEGIAPGQSVYVLMDEYTIQREHDNALYAYSLQFAHVMVNARKNGEIASVSASNDSQTSKGISLSDSIDTVISTYEDHYYTYRDDQGFTIIGYVDRNQKRTLEFWHIEDELYRIILEDCRR